VVEHFESMESIPVDWLPGEPKVVGCGNVKKEVIQLACNKQH
jgi:hypothetical protein